jgi:Kelch motif
MRNKYLLSALITFILLSCKKDTKEISEVQPAVATDDYTVCYGSNTWENGIAYLGDPPDLQVVYNNKVYYFNNQLPNPIDPFRDKITIYDGTSWEVLSSDIPFEPLYIGFAFVIGNKGYFGYTQYVGSSSHGNSWQYNFTTNTWTSIEDFPDYYLDNPAYFTAGNKGYVVGGFKTSSAFNSYYTWEFDPSATPKWRKRANLSGVGRSGAQGFTIGNKGYIVGGKTRLPYPAGDIYNKALFEYNPAANTWTTKAEFPGTGRTIPKSFVIDGYAYVGGGYTGETHPTDFYKYDPIDNDWVQIPNYTSTGTLRQAFSLNDKGYALWTPGYPDPYRFKKYNPRICGTISTGGVVIP